VTPLLLVLRADPGYWQKHDDKRIRLQDIVAGVIDVPDEVADAIAEWRRCTA
jgi:hypothetical protein